MKDKVKGFDWVLLGSDDRAIAGGALRHVCSALLADDTAPLLHHGTRMYWVVEPGDEGRVQVVNLGREFHVFGAVGRPDRLHDLAGQVGAALVAEGGVAA